MKSIFLVACLFVLLSGCATPVQKYALQNEAQPYAEIQSSIKGAYDRNEAIQIYVMGEGGCGFFNFDHIKNQQLLFSIRKSNSEPQGYVRVATDKPLRLRYFEEVSGGRTCEIMVEAKLDAGKKYSLDGGFQYKDGVIPILMGTRSCSFGMRSETQGQPLAIKKLYKSTLCDK